MTHVQMRCRACDAMGDRCEVLVLQEMMYGSREDFGYGLCRACGCLQILDIPADLGRFYPPGYYSQRPRAEPADRGRLRRWLVAAAGRTLALQPQSLMALGVRRIALVPTDFETVGRYLTHAALPNADVAILDVGCGSSPHRLTAMRRCGFPRVMGLDPFIDADTDFHGVPVRKCRLDEMSGEFGFVMFHHSLEHMPDPLGALRQAHDLLTPGGSCLIRVPVMGTYLWRRYGPHWVELDAPRHLHLFSVGAIGALAARAGFDVMHTEFDSEPWEIESSEAYAGGVALVDQAAPSDLDPPVRARRKAVLAQLARLNAVGDAGRACFYLRRPGRERESHLTR